MATFPQAMEGDANTKQQRRSSQDQYVEECHKQDEKLRAYTFPVFLETHAKWKTMATEDYGTSPKTEKSAFQFTSPPSLLTDHTYTEISSFAASPDESLCKSSGDEVDVLATQFENTLCWQNENTTEFITQRPTLLQNRRSSWLSTYSASSGKSETASPTSRKHCHRRSSAMSIDRPIVRQAGTAKHGPRVLGSMSMRQKMRQLEDSRSSVHSHKSQGSLSPFLVMADTSQQLRRNSESYFQIEAELYRRGQSKLNSAVYAGFPETGDQSPKSINIDLAQPISFSQSRQSHANTTPRMPKYYNSHLPQFQCSDKSSPEDEHDTDQIGIETNEKEETELLSLKDFLINS
ncbi:LANO_0E09626g1_1 [Lachancea nothofagi CBS 11611]|uniref:LANO_0E09626g1_1 n=1 Tax=Lachancea nothofagi CBS 11611 TaxID=1266666 RepID=A0A1G4JVY1_9SACH|nr:LANO_0E09626g1_1 [Lachancea nothofagi CBS 11611]